MWFTFNLRDTTPFSLYDKNLSNEISLHQRICILPRAGQQIGSQKILLRAQIFKKRISLFLFKSFKFRHSSQRFPNYQRNLINETHSQKIHDMKILILVIKPDRKMIKIT